MNGYEQIEQLLENYLQELIPLNRDTPPRVQRGDPFIYEHMFDPKLTISWMIEQCHINRKSFPTIFVRRTGFMHKDYILHHRIEAAKQLLDQTEATITMIALSVGFRSLSSFDKIFVDRVGFRPSRWRAQTKNRKRKKSKNSGHFSGQNSGRV